MSSLVNEYSPAIKDALKEIAPDLKRFQLGEQQADEKSQRGVLVDRSGGKDVDVAQSLRLAEEGATHDLRAAFLKHGVDPDSPEGGGAIADTLKQMRENAEKGARINVEKEQAEAILVKMPQVPDARMSEAKTKAKGK
jgi:hypothetical protein